MTGIIRALRIISFILLTFSLDAHTEENRMEIKVDFRVNSSRIERDFSDNARNIDDIIRHIQTIRRDTTLRITSVVFCGAASPEGSGELNRRLARARLTALERLIRDNADIPDSIISTDDSYIPWEYLLEQTAMTDMEWRDSVAAIINTPPEPATDPDNGQQVDRRIVRLKRLDNRRVWDRLMQSIFGKMRNAMAVIVTSRERRADTACSPAADTGGLPQHVPAGIRAEIPRHGGIRRQTERPSGRSFLMSARTNMLYDALAIPNIGVEFHLGRNWSVAANWMYAWWSRDRRHRWWRVYGGDAGVSLWFGKASRRRALTGHHAGVYAQMLTYDFELGGAGRLGDRWTYGAGVQYGYSLPAGKRLNIDFTVGVGFVRGEYKKYHPADGCYVWDSTHILNWFGPTKAEVSLVWLIGSGASGKGGGR